MIEYPSCTGERENLKIELIILHAERSGKSSDMYLEFAWFESWPGH
jgi:hypothetical protein